MASPGVWHREALWERLWLPKRGVKAGEHPEPGVPDQDAPSDDPGALDDQAGDLDEGLSEGAELHLENEVALCMALVFPALKEGTNRAHQAFRVSVSPCGAPRLQGAGCVSVWICSSRKSHSLDRVVHPRPT